MIFSSSFFNTFYDDEFYSSLFEKHNVYGNVDNPDAKIMEIIAYFNGEVETIGASNLVFADIRFSDKELSHMEDVKVVIRNFKTLYFISFFLFVILFSGFIYSIFSKYRTSPKFKKNFSLFFIRLQISVLAFSCAILFVFWAISFFNFTFLFDWMHKLLFDPNTWTFPSDSLSILLFPQGFFYDFFFQVLRNVFWFIVMLGLLLLFVSFLYGIGQKSDGTKADIESNGKN